MDGPQPIGALIVPAVRRATQEQEIGVYDRVRDRILDACPEYIESWGLARVATVVASGRVPEIEIVKAIDRYERRLRLAQEAKLPPITKRTGYLSVVFKQVLGRFGVPWTNSDQRESA